MSYGAYEFLCCCLLIDCSLASVTQLIILAASQMNVCIHAQKLVVTPPRRAFHFCDVLNLTFVDTTPISSADMDSASAAILAASFILTSFYLVLCLWQACTRVCCIRSDPNGLMKRNHFYYYIILPLGCVQFRSWPVALGLASHANQKGLGCHVWALFGLDFKPARSDMCMRIVQDVRHGTHHVERSFRFDH